MVADQDVEDRAQIKVVIQQQSLPVYSVPVCVASSSSDRNDVCHIKVLFQTHEKQVSHLSFRYAILDC